MTFTNPPTPKTLRDVYATEPDFDCEANLLLRPSISRTTRAKATSLSRKARKKLRSCGLKCIRTAHDFHMEAALIIGLCLMIGCLGFLLWLASQPEDPNSPRKQAKAQRERVEEAILATARWAEMIARWTERNGVQEEVARLGGGVGGL